MANTNKKQMEALRLKQKLISIKLDEAQIETLKVISEKIGKDMGIHVSFANAVRLAIDSYIKDHNHGKH